MAYITFMKQNKKEYDKTRYLANRKKLLAQKKAWRIANPNKIHKYQKKYYKKHTKQYKSRAKRWQLENAERHKKNCKHWQSVNAERHRGNCKRWQLENPKKQLEFTKSYRLRNKTKCKEGVKRWCKKNPELVRAYDKKRRSTPKGALDALMGTNILQALGREKRGQRWERLVGYTLNDLMKHLESKFTKRMSWKNRGEWHIDHIVPKCRFHYRTANDPEFKICWGLANLQPLWAKDNQIKRTKTMQEYLKDKTQ